MSFASHCDQAQGLCDPVTDGPVQARYDSAPPAVTLAIDNNHMHYRGKFQ